MKKKSIFINKSILLLILFIGINLILGPQVEAFMNVNINPQQVKFNFKSKPTADIEQKLKLNRKSDIPGALYYRVTQLTDDRSEHTISPKYISANTPYSSAYQSLKYSRLFLAEDDTISMIKLKLSKKAWSKVPAGTYKGWLTSSRGPQIRVIVKIKPYTNIKIDPGSITINAPGGPGTYKAEENVTAVIEANHSNWHLRMYTEPLVHNESEYDEEEEISPQNIFMLLSNKSSSYKSLEQGIDIRGTDYGRGTVLDLTFKVKTTWDHPAGKYKGKIYFTLSKNEDRLNNTNFSF